jgi:acyl-CoA synthetase (NDP forming)
VNPRYQEIHGLKAYASLAHIKADLDTVFIAVAAEHGPGIMQQAVDAGARAVLLNATGYADAGPEGRARQEQIVALATGAGIPVCGPNNLGVINIVDRVPLWTSAHLPAMNPGHVAVISQSGSVALAIGEDVSGLGLSHLITAGNEAVTGVADYVQALADDPRVKVVLLFLETIRDPAGLAAAAAKARAAGQTLVALKIGRSAKGRTAVVAHSGALSGEDAVVTEYFRKHGIIRVRDVDDLVQIAKLKLRPPPAPTASPAVITLSGGQAAAVADAADEIGVTLADFPAVVAAGLAPLFGGHPPQNPCDAWGTGWDKERAEKIISILAQAPEIDPIVFALDIPSTGHADGPMAVEIAQIAAQQSAIGKKVMFVANSAISGVKPELKEICNGNGFPILFGVGGAFRAIGAWVAQARDERTATLPEIPARVVDGREATEAKLRAAIKFVNSQQVVDEADAVRCAEILGYPVVIKGIAPEIAHKTELGLVRLGLTDATSVMQAYKEVRSILDAAAPAGLIEVQPMIGAGVELLVAARRDALFGPVIVAGAGGKLVELVADSTLRLGAVTEEVAGEMLSEIRAGKLIAGYREGVVFDDKAARSAIAALSRIMAEAGDDITVVEINPLVVLPTGKGAVAVDLLIE